MVHRERYDDWSLPKGGIKAAEHPLVAAVREVGEETGCTVAVERRLASTKYRTETRRTTVDFWAMRYVEGSHRPSAEVDRLQWLPPVEAAGIASYDTDRLVLDSFAEVDPGGDPVVLVRHAKAGKRDEHHGDDRLRPLDARGTREARDSVALLAAFRPTVVASADRLRCEQTVAPLAVFLGLPVTAAPELSDEAFLRHPDRTLGAVLRHTGGRGPAVLCSQGTAIPGVLERLGAPGGPDYSCRKGSVWALTFRDGRLRAADYYPRPWAPRAD
jgi:8-oxo-dGTP diphosphatase